MINFVGPASLVFQIPCGGILAINVTVKQIVFLDKLLHLSRLLRKSLHRSKSGGRISPEYQLVRRPWRCRTPWWISWLRRNNFLSSGDFFLLIWLVILPMRDVLRSCTDFDLLLMTSKWYIVRWLIRYTSICTEFSSRKLVCVANSSDYLSANFLHISDHDKFWQYYPPTRIY